MEVIVVEGRDDEERVKAATGRDTIATHGFAISAETWQKLEKAYERRGLVILTDPDHAGEEIRKRLGQRFPGARHAYVDRQEATSGDDIGIENASAAAIRIAIEKAHGGETAPSEQTQMKHQWTMDDMRELRLVGEPRSAVLRDEIGSRLGIGGGNAKAFLAKLNKFAITEKEMEDAK